MWTRWPTRTSLVVQRLRLHTFSTGGVRLIPGRGTKFPPAALPKTCFKKSSGTQVPASSGLPNLRLGRLVSRFPEPLVALGSHADQQGGLSGHQSAQFHRALRSQGPPLAFMPCVTIVKSLVLLPLNLCFVSGVLGTIRRACEQRRTVQCGAHPSLLPHSQALTPDVMSTESWGAHAPRSPLGLKYNTPH